MSIMICPRLSLLGSVLLVSLSASSAFAVDAATWQRQGCYESGYFWDNSSSSCLCPSSMKSVDGACVSASYAAQNMSTPLAGLYDAYSPSLLGTRMWIGGWATQQDMCPPSTPAGKCTPSIPGYGEDKIYYSDFNGTQWSQPTLSFYLPGYHVNDPSVIQHPQHDDWLFMYYTALADGDSPGNLTTANHIGFASSIDGGATWTDHGIVIADGWSPSAIVVGDEIWVYYHTGSQDWREMRTRFDLNGWQVNGTDQLQFHTAGPVYISNLNVQQREAKYLLLANSGDLTQILRYVSMDGLNWVQDPSGPLINGGSNLVLTPTSVDNGDGTYDVYFGYSDGTKGAFSIQDWTFADPPAPITPPPAPPSPPPPPAPPPPPPPNASGSNIPMAPLPPAFPMGRGTVPILPPPTLPPPAPASNCALVGQDCSQTGVACCGDLQCVAAFGGAGSVCTAN